MPSFPPLSSDFPHLPFSFFVGFLKLLLHSRSHLFHSVPPCLILINPKLQSHRRPKYGSRCTREPIFTPTSSHLHKGSKIINRNWGGSDKTTSLSLNSGNRFPTEVVGLPPWRFSYLQKQSYAMPFEFHVGLNLTSKCWTTDSLPSLPLQRFLQFCGDSAFGSAAPESARLIFV